MKKLIINSFIILFSLLIVACNEKKVDSRRFAQEMKNRQLKRVNQGRIMEESLLKGQMTVQLIDTTFKTRINDELTKNGVSKAMQLCNIAIYGIKDSLSSVYNADIKRVNKSILTLGNKYERELFDAYLYNEEQNLPMEDNLQDMKNGFILYTKPIILNQKNCITCHAEGSKDVAILQKAYPQSPVFNLKKGSLIGMWSVSLSQQEIIKRIKL